MVFASVGLVLPVLISLQGVIAILLIVNVNARKTSLRVQEVRYVQTANVWVSFIVKSSKTENQSNLEYISIGSINYCYYGYVSMINLQEHAIH